MFRPILIPTALCTVLGLALIAAAQPPRNPPPSGAWSTASGASQKSTSKYLAIPGLYPLSMASVEHDIGLTADQRQQLKAVSDGYMDSMQQLGKTFNQLGPDDKEKQGKEFYDQQVQAAANARRKAEAILTPQQLKIVQAVAFQMQATNALADPALQEKLGLTAEQRERLTKVFDAAAEKMHQLQRDTAQQATQVLEPEQMAALKKQMEAQQKPQ